MHYKALGHSFPDHTRCIRTAVPEGKSKLGAELILTPPVTPEAVLIDEGMVNTRQIRMGLSHFKAFYLQTTALSMGHEIHTFHGQ